MTKLGQNWQQRPFPLSRTKAATRERERPGAWCLSQGMAQEITRAHRRAGGGHFVLVVARSGQILRPKWQPPTTPAELRPKSRRRGYDPPWQMPTHRQEPLRTERVSQTLPSCGELQNLEVPLGTKGRIECHGCKCAQLGELFEQVAVLQEELSRL